jgi:hypothetical protein
MFHTPLYLQSYFYKKDKWTKPVDLPIKVMLFQKSMSTKKDTPFLQAHVNIVYLE